MYDAIPVAKFYPWKVVIYNEYPSSCRWSPGAPGPKNQKYTGNITSKSSRLIRDAIQLLDYITPQREVYDAILQKSMSFKLSFITLTLSSSQKHPDSFITSTLLRPFLRHFQSNGTMQNYVWKAEKQKNGNIHYHIISDAYVNYTICLNYWNRIQSRLDYIDDFFDQYNHRSPNSVDIRKVTGSRELQKYLSKYVSKSGQKITGKVWDCSHRLHNFQPLATSIDNYIFDHIQHLENTAGAKKVVHDHCTIIYHNTKHFSGII